MIIPVRKWFNPSPPIAHPANIVLTLLDHYSFGSNYVSGLRTFLHFPQFKWKRTVYLNPWILHRGRTQQSSTRTIRFSWRRKRHSRYIMKVATYLLNEIKCAHAPTWPSTPSLWMYLIDKTALVQVSRPRYNWHCYQHNSSIGCIWRKSKAAFHDFRAIFPVIKESPPCL